jgi:DNA-binding transcriptional LysR family regulator
MEDLTRLRVLVALAGCGSFSRAGEELGYTQSAVSRQIATLEAEAGTELVDRSSRPARLTEAGEALARRAEEAIAALAAAREELEALADLRTGRLRVGTFASAGAVLVVPALTEFRSRHPGMDVSLVEAGPDEVIAELRAGELELAVSYDYPDAGETLDDGLVSHHLLDDADRLVVHPSHPAAKRARVAIAQLGREAWIVPALDPNHPARRMFAGACAAAGYEPEVAYRTNSCEMSQALVASGGAITLVPELALHPVHAGVVVRKLFGPGPVRRVFAARRPTKHPSPAASAFLELLVGVAARHAQD